MLGVNIVSWSRGRCSSFLHLCGIRQYQGCDEIIDAYLVFSLQVTALDTGISLNMFYGDPGDNVFISKMFREPYRQHFHYWFLNIIEQNRDQQSFKKILSRLPEVCGHFFVKQWHEVPSEAQVTMKPGRSSFASTNVKLRLDLTFTSYKQLNFLYSHLSYLGTFHVDSELDNRMQIPS